MRKILFFAVLILFSCEKAFIDMDDGAGDTPAASKLEGNLIVSISQIEQMPFMDYTRAAVADVCTRVNFAVYNMAGTRVKQINQQVGGANYGTASFQLDEGEYQLVVVAHSSDGNPTMTDPTKIRFTNTQGFTDTFLYSGTITIGAEPQTHTLTLRRITSLCRFVVTDDYPFNVKKMRFYYTGGSGAFNASTGFGTVNSKQEVKFDVTSGQKQFDLYTILHNTEGTIHLKVSALDAADNVLREREFDVQLAQNKITWFTGAFFADSDFNNTTIDIDINTDWLPGIQVTF